jgi:hypothetical protein
VTRVRVGDLLERPATKILLTLALLLTLTLVPARAGAAPTTEGRTAIELSKPLYERLKASGVRLERLRPGTLSRRVLTLPATSGQLEATYGSGYLFYDGGIRLRAGKRKAVLKRLILNTAERWLRGRIGGKELTIATVEGTRAGWVGFDIQVGLKLKLTARAANLLNRRLGLEGVFRAGRPLAVADTVYEPETVGVNGGKIELAFDAGFLAKLASLEVTLSTAEGAALANSTLSLPIREGAISPDLLRGILLGETGFALLQSGPQPEQQQQARFIAINLSLESDRLGAAINLTSGLFGGSQLAAVDFGTVPVQVDPVAGTIAAQGATAVLDAGVAAALNDTFAAPMGKTGVFAGGEPLGTVSFAVTTR